MTYSAGDNSSDPKEKKRERNRIAQRTYRRNQKLRLQALEEAVGISRSQSPNTSTPESHTDTRNDTPFHDPTPTPQQASPVALSIPPTPPQDASFTPPQERDLWTPMLDPILDENPLTGSSVELGRPALHRAVSANNVSMTRLLLDRGADSRRLDSNGQTALHLAVDVGSERVIMTMLEKKVDVNAKDALGRTALYRAVLNENEKITRMLLEAKVDVNSRDAFEEVVLHLAVEKGLETFVFLLLSHGADIEA